MPAGATRTITIPQSSASPANISLTEPPVCALRIGITGHRPPKLAQNMEPQIREALREILKAARHSTVELAKLNPGYAEREPVLHMISLLAEGADRLAAEEALHLGFKLQCPLPAARDEYRQDFGVPSAMEFDKLLGKAEYVFELDGQRVGAWLDPTAYEAAGRITLAHSDVLIAVWNGELGEQGGTGQIVREAQLAGIPTLRIPLDNPAHIEFLAHSVASSNPWREELHRALTAILPAPAKASAHVSEFLHRTSASDSGADPIATQRAQADEVAARYGTLYRRAYKTAYFLAPVAVFCAVVGLVSEPMESSANSLELACILAIVAVTLWGRWGKWHDRWLDARVLAEQFRTWEFLAPIALTPPTSRLPPYVAAKAEGDWTGWYFRARVREYGFISARLTPDYLASYRRMLSSVVEGQLQHHRDKGEARKRTYERTENGALIVFILTATICVVHLFSRHGLNIKSVLGLSILGGATAALPAVGAAFEGLQAQGEYRRLAERAEGMIDYFSSIPSQLSKPEALSYSTLAIIARGLSGVMLDEVSDWRNLVRIRDLHPV
jgi:hypothetical protein